MISYLPESNKQKSMMRDLSGFRQKMNPGVSTLFTAASLSRLLGPRKPPADGLLGKEKMFDGLIERV